MTATPTPPREGAHDVTTAAALETAAKRIERLKAKGWEMIAFTWEEIDPVVALARRAADVEEKHGALKRLAVQSLELLKGAIKRAEAAERRVEELETARRQFAEVAAGRGEEMELPITWMDGRLEPPEVYGPVTMAGIRAANRRARARHPEGKLQCEFCDGWYRNYWAHKRRAHGVGGTP